MAVCSVVLIIGFSTVTLATNGFGDVTGHEAGRAEDIGASPSALAPTAQFYLGRGYAEASSSIRQPSGVMVWARRSVPRGSRAFAPLLLCRLRGVVNTQCRFWHGKST